MGAKNPMKSIAQNHPMEDKKKDKRKAKRLVACRNQTKEGRKLVPLVIGSYFTF
jgi:hypothetical protein